jgi:hypothetical protein
MPLHLITLHHTKDSDLFPRENFRNHECKDHIVLRGRSGLFTRERRLVETSRLHCKHLVQLGRHLLSAGHGSTPIPCKTWSTFGARSQVRRVLIHRVIGSRSHPGTREISKVPYERSQNQNHGLHESYQPICAPRVLLQLFGNLLQLA